MLKKRISKQNDLGSGKKCPYFLWLILSYSMSKMESFDDFLGEIDIFWLMFGGQMVVLHIPVCISVINLPRNMKLLSKFIFHAWKDSNALIWSNMCIWKYEIVVYVQCRSFYVKQTLLILSLKQWDISQSLCLCLFAYSLNPNFNLIFWGLISHGVDMVLG